MDALHLARSEAEVPVSPSELNVNANAWLLNCENRTVDLRTGELLRHRLADLLTKMASVD
jgi:putative DNA primase/helicase